MDKARIVYTAQYGRAAIRTALVVEFRAAAQEEGAFWFRSTLATAGVAQFSDLSDVQIVAALAELQPEPVAGPLTVNEMVSHYRALNVSDDPDCEATVCLLCEAILDHVLQPATASH